MRRSNMVRHDQIYHKTLGLYWIWSPLTAYLTTSLRILKEWFLIPEKRSFFVSYIILSIHLYVLMFISIINYKRLTLLILHSCMHSGWSSTSQNDLQNIKNKIKMQDWLFFEIVLCTLKKKNCTKAKKKHSGKNVVLFLTNK